MKALFSLIAAALWAVAAAAGERPWDEISFGGFDVVFLGEVHDNPDHHRNQAEWVARMRPAALVFEMLTPALALAVGDDRDDVEALGRRLRWDERGWPDFAMYHPIFLAAPHAPVFGAEVPRDDLRAAMRDGAATAMGDAGRVFGLDRPLSEDEQTLRETGQKDAHCGALRDSQLPGMVEAQRLRDAALARAVLAALAETGGPVAVITGNGHARTDWGAPAALAAAAPGLAVLSVGQMEAPQSDAAPFDVWTVTSAPDREDPCAAFRAD